jgi:hypothetical protein
MDDRRYDKIQRDNAEVLHVVESPLRMLMGMGKFVLFVLGLIFLLFYRQVGWIIDIGPRSQRDRDARAQFQVQQLKQYNGESDDLGREWAQYDVDFRTQPDPAADLESRDRFWPDDRLPWVESDVWDSTADNHRTKAFTTIPSGGGDGRHGIPYCVVALHPGMKAAFFDDAPGGWGTRWNDALDRKSSRMQRDYEIGAMMTAALRHTLANLKLHRPPDVRPQSYCDASQGDAAYRRALISVYLRQAPMVRIKYISIPDYYADTNPDHGQYDAEIMGFCEPEACDDGLLWGTTYKDDLFAPDAPLTIQQMVVEGDMLDMTGEDFWLVAARENGVTDLEAVKSARKKALEDLNREFSSTNFNI